MLFSYAGRKLKVFAKVMFWIMIAASVILAFVFGWETYFNFYLGKNQTEFQPITFFAILIGGLLCSYFFALPLVALGEVCEDVEDIKCHTSRLNKELIDSKIKK